MLEKGQTTSETLRKTLENILFENGPMARCRNWIGDTKELFVEEPLVPHALRRPNTSIMQLEGRVGELANIVQEVVDYPNDLREMMSLFLEHARQLNYTEKGAANCQDKVANEDGQSHRGSQYC